MSLFFFKSSLSWNFHSFKADVIFRNSQKPFEAKSREKDGCSILAINFWTGNCLTNCLAKVQAFFVHTVLQPPKYFHIISLVDWPCGMSSKWTVPLILKKVMIIVFVCDFDMHTSFELFIPLRSTWFFHSFYPISSKNWSLIFLTKCRNMYLYQCHNFHTTGIALLGHTVKSFRELHSHNTHANSAMQSSF
jgi:hypothetical protein